MSHPSSQRKTFPYWLTLLVGIILACVLMNAITMNFSGGMPESWQNLGTPPVAIKTIVDVGFRQIWVETQDSSLFTAEIIFSCKNKGGTICWEWESVKGLSEIPKQNFPMSKGSDCEKLQDGVLPSNPKGKIVECVYTYELGVEYREEGYFALMTDGDILYWHGGSNAIATQFNFIFSTFIFPLFVAIIISAVYWVIHIIHRTHTGSAIT